MTVAEGTLLNKAQLIASVKDKSYQPELLHSDDMVVHRRRRAIKRILRFDRRMSASADCTPVFPAQGRFYGASAEARCAASILLQTAPDSFFRAMEANS